MQLTIFLWVSFKKKLKRILNTVLYFSKKKVWIYWKALKKEPQLTYTGFGIFEAKKVSWLETKINKWESKIENKY